MEISVKQSQKAIIWLCLAHMACDIYTGFVNPIMPFIAAKLGFSMAIATVILSISQICSNMFQPVFGFMADNILHRFFIFWGLILVSTFIPLAPNAPCIPVLIACTILGSLGSSFFHPQSMGFVNKFSGTDARICSDNMGLFISLGTLGFAFGPIIAAVIVQNLGLSVVSWTSLIGLTLAVLMFLFVPKLSLIEKKPEHKKFLKSFKEILSCTQMDFLILIAMMKSLIANSCGILLPFLWKNMGHSPLYIGSALFLFIFAGAVGSFLSPKLENLMGSKFVIYFSMWATLPMMLAFAFTYKVHPVLSMVIFGITGFTTMLAQPVVMVWAQRTLPEYRSVVAGFINGFCWGLVAICMSFMGAVAQKFGIMTVLVSLSVIPALASYYVKYLKEVKED